MPPGTVPDPGRPTPSAGGATAPGFPTAFFAHVEEAGKVVLETRSAKPLYVLSCTGEYAVEHFNGGAWSTLRDDRPHPSMNPGYFLDGTFVQPSFDEGCDVRACVPILSPVSVGYALEYYQLGTMQAPPYTGISHPVPVIESRGRRGDLRVRVTYSEDSNCATSMERTVDFNVPTGVCCAIENEGCMNYGRRGGWAPSEGYCPATDSNFYTYFRSRQDGWGCQKLVEDPEICCGCDEDAGVAP